MQLYISQNGGIEGPHSVDVVQTMLREGRLAPSDLGAVPGDADWKPLSDLIDCSVAGAAPAGGPPPIPTPPAAADLDAQFMIDGLIPNGTRGKSVRQIVEGVQAGGRFVIYQYVVSVVVLSFRRSSAITYIPPGKSAAGPAIGWSLLTMAVGWWGIPWGIIYSVGALWRNAAGGVDVTEPLLASWIGPRKADAIVRARPKPPSGGLWALRAMIVSPLVLIALMMVVGMIAAADREAEESKLAGFGEFKNADAYVQRKGVRGGGNTPLAVEVADFHQQMLQDMRDSAISDEGSRRSTNSNTTITVWCEVHGDRCFFIVNVPDLRHFTNDAKDFVCDAAWYAAQISARLLDLSENAEIAVAVRGIALYDRLIIGRFNPAADTNADDIESTLKAAIRETDRSLSRKNRLAAYFVPSA